jgi:hypothetical protein
MNQQARVKRKRSEFYLTHISHLKGNCFVYNSAKMALDGAVSGFSVNKSRESDG